MRSIFQVILALTILSSVASAQTKLPTPEDVRCPCVEPLNRFGFNYRMSLGISARFKNLGRFDALSNPGAAIPGIDHTYDDGYNMVDSSTNSGNSTWFWGYQNAGQVPGNDTIVMHSSSSPGNLASKDQKEDPQHGGEITYNRQLGRIGKLKWGIEAGVGLTGVTIDDNGTLRGSVTQTNDAFVLDGTIPPAPPYNHGQFPTGSDPLISDIPIRTVITSAGGAAVTGKRKFDADIYGLRFGPYLEMPINERLSFSLSGGLTVLSINSDFKFQEEVTIAGVGTRASAGDGSRSEWQLGGYVGGNFNYAIAENVSLFAGAQYQAAGAYSHKENGRKAELDLGNAVFLNFGVGFSF